MNLDELKAAWLEYDNRLAATEEINQKVIASMIRERSVSRIARIRRRYAGFIFLFLFYSICLPFGFVGDPLDYVYMVQYLPLAGLVAGCMLMVVFLFRTRLALQKINLDRQNLQEALQQVILVYVKYRRSFKYITSFAFFSGALIQLSFLPAKIAHSGLGKAIFSTSLFYLVMFICYYYFYYFKKQPGWNEEMAEEEKGFRADLDELNELKSQ